MRSVYIAACDEKGGVYHCSLTDNGKLEILHFLPCPKPMYLAVENRTMYIILRDDPAENAIGSALITVPLLADGAFGTPSLPLPTHGQEACHLDVLNGTAYLVNYTSGSIIKMPDRLVTHSGRSVHPTRQTAPHTHFIQRTPDQCALFVVDLGLDTIFTYDFELNPLHTARVPNGHGCRHLDYSADGRTVYCANELASTVSVFTCENNQLSLRDTVSALPSDFNGNSTIAAIRVNQNFVYVSNRGHDSIARLEVCGNSLRLLECTPCGGGSPRDFNIFGDWLICTNETGNNVTVFRLRDGKPTEQTFDLPLLHPLCVIAAD